MPAQEVTTPFEKNQCGAAGYIKRLALPFHQKRRHQTWNDNLVHNHIVAPCASHPLYHRTGLASSQLLCSLRPLARGISSILGLGSDVCRGRERGPETKKALDPSDATVLPVSHTQVGMHHKLSFLVPDEDDDTIFVVHHHSQDDPMYLPLIETNSDDALADATGVDMRVVPGIFIVSKV